MIAKETAKRNEFGGTEIDYSKMNSSRTSAKSLILYLFDKEYPYYTLLSSVTRYRYAPNLEGEVAIMENIKIEIQNDWLSSIKGIVSAEIYSDFLEMTKHLLKKDYKDAAAVMIGGVLKEHLRQLCSKQRIDTEYEKDGKMIPLKADRMNGELVKAGVYNKLDHKNIAAQFDLRNSAAHANYSEYDNSRVLLMLDYVFNFLSRNQL